MVQSREIILSNGSRLLYGMLAHALKKAPGLEVIDGDAHPGGLMATVEEREASWLVVFLTSEGEVPQAVEPLLDQRSDIGLVALAADGSRARIHQPGGSGETLAGLSLDELIAVLRH